MTEKLANSVQNFINGPSKLLYNFRHDKEKHVHIKKIRDYSPLVNRQRNPVASFIFLPELRSGKITGAHLIWTFKSLSSRTWRILRNQRRHIISICNRGIQAFPISSKFSVNSRINRPITLKKCSKAKAMGWWYSQRSWLPHKNLRRKYSVPLAACFSPPASKSLGVDH